MQSSRRMEKELLEDNHGGQKPDVSLVYGFWCQKYSYCQKKKDCDLALQDYSKFLLRCTSFSSIDEFAVGQAQNGYVETLVI